MNGIEMIPTKSTTVPAIGYDSKNNIMYAQFGSGAMYKYLDISQSEVNSIRNSPSEGTKLKEVVKLKEYSKI